MTQQHGGESSELGGEPTTPLDIEPALLEQLKQAVATELGQLVSGYRTRATLLKERQQELREFVASHQRTFTPEQIHALGTEYLSLQLGTDGVNPKPDEIYSWRLWDHRSISAELRRTLGVTEHTRLFVHYYAPPLNLFALSGGLEPAVLIDANRLEPLAIASAFGGRIGDRKPLDERWQRAWTSHRTELEELLRTFTAERVNSLAIERHDGVSVSVQHDRNRAAVSLSQGFGRWISCRVQPGEPVIQTFFGKNYEVPLHVDVPIDVRQGEAARDRDREIRDLEAGQQWVVNAVETLNVAIRDWPVEQSTALPAGRELLATIGVDRLRRVTEPPNVEKYLSFPLRTVLAQLRGEPAPTSSREHSGSELAPPAGGHTSGVKEAGRVSQSESSHLTPERRAELVEQLKNSRQSLATGPDKDHPTVLAMLARLDAVLGKE